MALSKMSIAQKFSFSRDISCGNNIEPQSLSRTMVGWPEGHGLGSSEGDGEMNRVTNFTSSNGSFVGMMLRHWDI